MTEITTISRSSKIANIEEDFILDETTTTRKIFRASIVDNFDNPEANVRGYLIHQKKKSKDEWEDINEQKLNELKSGEGIKLELKSEITKKLYDILSKCYCIAEKGVARGIRSYEIIERDDAIEIIKVPSNREHFVKELIKQNYSDEIWQEIISVNPDLATKLSLSKIQNDRQNVLTEFEDNISQELPESYWQSFIEKNTWIFGYGLNYQFLNQLTDQSDIGGTTYDGKNSQKGDYLINTIANSKFTVLVEIKKPSTKLITSKKQYRNGAYLLGAELYGSVSQIQGYLNTWDTEGSKKPQNLRKLEKDNIFTYLPKGIIVIGNTNHLINNEMIRSFELFRRSINNPEIITFDELLERTRFIVGNTNTEDIEFENEEISEPPF